MVNRETVDGRAAHTVQGVRLFPDDPDEDVKQARQAAKGLTDLAKTAALIKERARARADKAQKLADATKNAENDVTLDHARRVEQKHADKARENYERVLIELARAADALAHAIQDDDDDDDDDEQQPTKKRKRDNAKTQETRAQNATKIDQLVQRMKEANPRDFFKHVKRSRNSTNAVIDNHTRVIDFEIDLPLLEPTHPIDERVANMAVEQVMANEPTIDEDTAHVPIAIIDKDGTLLQRERTTPIRAADSDGRAKLFPNDADKVAKAVGNDKIVYALFAHADKAKPRWILAPAEKVAKNAFDGFGPKALLILDNAKTRCMPKTLAQMLMDEPTCDTVYAKRVVTVRRFSADF